MIKRKGLVMLLTLVMFLSLMIPAGAASNIKIVINDNTVSSDVPPIIEDGRTLVPLRVVMEYLGAQVTYTNTTKTITVVKSNTILTLTLNKNTVFKNGENIKLDVPAKLVSGRTVVPLRFIGQALGSNVEWQHESKTVVIGAPGSGSTPSDSGGESGYDDYVPVVSIPDSTTPNWANIEKEILDLVNKTRGDHGLTPLVWMNELADMARSHSDDMATNNFFSHSSETTGTPNDRAVKIGLPGAAENIAAGYRDAQSVHDAWMTSPGHRANILNPDYRYIGVGYYQENDISDKYGGKYYTENFVGGDIVFLQPAQESITNIPKVVIKGYSTQENVELTVYKLMNKETYSDKYTIDLKVTNGKINHEITLTKGKGLYALWASNYDVRYVEYK